MAMSFTTMANLILGMFMYVNRKGGSKMEKNLVEREKIVEESLNKVKTILVETVRDVSKLETEMLIELNDTGLDNTAVGVKVELEDLYDLLAEVSRLMR